MKSVATAILGLLFAGSASAQSPGTLNLIGPSTTPGAPAITRVDQMNGPINAALAPKADAANGVLTTPTITGGTIFGTPISGAPGSFTTLSASDTFTGITGLFTTLSASGALSGATAAISSTAAIGGALTLGAGGSGSQSIVASGTGNMSVQMGGSSSVMNVKNSGGTSVLQIGGSGNAVAVQTQLTLPGKVWVGPTTGANAALFSNSTWSGSPGGNISASLNQLQMSEGILVGSGGELNGMSITLNTNAAGFTGQRHALTVIQGITAAPAGNGGTYTALNTKINASVNVGGTGLTAVDSAGSVFGINPVAHLASGATFWGQIVGGEIDTWVEAGASVVDKIGFQIIDVAGSVVQGARDDVALSLNNQYDPSSSTGFKVGLGIGRSGGKFPVSTNGTLIFGTGNVSSPGFTIANGIDWSLGTATGNWVNLGGVFTITGAGVASAAGYKVGATAGVACSGSPTGSFASVGGIVTHC